MVAKCHYVLTQLAIMESTMKTKPPSQDLAKLNLRLPLALRRRLKTKAQQEGRSMNAQAVQILSEVLEKEAGRKAA